MAQNPNPAIELANIAGITHTLDDWATSFSLAIVMLPDRPEAAAWRPVIERIYKTLGDSDVRTAIWVPSSGAVTRKIIGDLADRYLTFVDPDRALATSLGLERLPAFVHLRQDTTLVAAAQGWSVSEWQKVADGIAKHVHWTSPTISDAKNPPASAGWALAG